VEVVVFFRPGASLRGLGHGRQPTLPLAGMSAGRGSARAPCHAPRVHAVTTVHPDHLSSQLRADGWAVVKPVDLLGWLRATPLDLEPLAASWDDLPADPHLRDGGHYRSRRHGSFFV